jgi:hypothetical protein
MGNALIKMPYKTKARQPKLFTHLNLISLLTQSDTAKKINAR